MTDGEQDSVARLRSSYEAFNRGDFDAAVQMAHPEIEFVRPGGQAPLSGRDALRAWMEPDAFEELQLEPFEFTLEGDKILVGQHARARGTGSGIELDVRSWSVWTLNDEGLATRLEFYLQHQEAEAREAAGLRK